MRIAVLGSGAWGTALAILAHRANHEVKIWSRKHNTCLEINYKHQNNEYLADVKIPVEITATTELEDFIGYDVLILAIPAQSIRGVCQKLRQLNISEDKILVVCSKGIEQGSLKLMSEVIEEILPNNLVAILSGPNFALPIAQGLPAISSISAKKLDVAKELAKTLSNPFFKIYPNDDIVGTQIIGAAKNVLAIATGITIGKKLGENAKSAIFSRGANEISSLVIAKGGKIDTFLTPAGIGDLNLTCSSITSRNTSYGVAIAEDKHLEFKILAEGFHTAESIVMLAKSLNVEMPIAESIYKIIEHNYPVDTIIAELLARPV